MTRYSRLLIRLTLTALAALLAPPLARAVPVYIDPDWDATGSGPIGIVQKWTGRSGGSPAEAPKSVCEQVNVKAGSESRATGAVPPLAPSCPPGAYPAKPGAWKGEPKPMPRLL